MRNPALVVAALVVTVQRLGPIDVRVWAAVDNSQATVQDAAGCKKPALQ